MQTGLHITLASERLFTLWGVPLTNTLFTMWLVMAALLLAAFFIGRSLKLTPGRVQSAVEMAFEYVWGYVRDTLGSDKLARRYFPLIATIFLFILTANLLDFFPIFGTLTISSSGEPVPLFHALSADLNTTLTLAIISFLVVELTGILTLGVLKYVSKFVNSCLRILAARQSRLPCVLARRKPAGSCQSVFRPPSTARRSPGSTSIPRASGRRADEPPPRRPTLSPRGRLLPCSIKAAAPSTPPSPRRPC